MVENILNYNKLLTKPSSYEFSQNVKIVPCVVTEDVFVTSLNFKIISAYFPN